MDKFRVLVNRDDIRSKIAELAARISDENRGQDLVLIGVLKGSFVFMADLMRALDIPVKVDFVRLSSYGAGSETTGKVKVVQGLKTPVRDRHVLVVEDIVDTGLTVRFLLDYLRKRKPASVKLCALLDKPSRRLVEVPIDYLGFTVPDVFVVGCGIDLGEEFRHLPDVCILGGER